MAARLTAYLVALIVGVTFIAGLIVGAQRSADGPVDLIVVNGSVYTADGGETIAEAVAVQGNKILLVGSNREVQRLRRPQTVVVDAKGGAVLPGFNDTSADFIAQGVSQQHINLEGADTLLAVESTIKAWAAANPDSEWVLGRGWSAAAFEDRAPTRQLLDALVPDRPAYLLSRDGESAWVNTAALKRAQVTRRTASPDGGTIVKDQRGDPSGVLTEGAKDLVTRVLPVPTREERIAGLRSAIENAHRRGVTSVQDLNASVDELELYDAVRRDQALDVRVYAALPGHLEMTAGELDALDAVRTKYADDPLLKTGAVTLLAREEVDEELRRLVAELDARGWQVIIQAIGEGAVRIARDAVEFASRNQEPSGRERRHRVENAAEFDEPVQRVQLALSESRALGPVVDEVTREAAWSSFDEHRKGRLERDMLADLVILTVDIFAPAPQRPTQIDVATTIFDGRVVYTRPAESDN